MASMVTNSATTESSSAGVAHGEHPVTFRVVPTQLDVDAARAAQAAAACLTVHAAAKMFAQDRLTAIVIGCTAEGIMTENDLVKLAAKHADAKKLLVTEVMTHNPVCVAEDTPLSHVLRLMRDAKFRHMPVLSSETNCVVHVHDVVAVARSLFRSSNGVATKVARTVRKMFRAFTSTFRRRSMVPEEKSQQASSDPTACTWSGVQQSDSFATRPESTVLEAARLMIAKRVSAILVVSAEDGSLVGIFTESDIVRRVMARGADVASTQICVVMTLNPQTVSSGGSNSPLSALKLMFDKNFRHLPLVSGTGTDLRPTCVLDVLSLSLGVFGQSLTDSATGEEAFSLDTIYRGRDVFEARVRALADSDDPLVEPHAESFATAASDQTPDPPEGKKIAGTSRFASLMGKARKHKVAADTCVQQSEYAEAIKSYSRAMRFVQRAHAEADLAHDDQARTATSSVLAAATIDVLLCRADVHSISGDLSDALADFEAIRVTAASMGEDGIAANLQKLGLGPEQVYSAHFEVLMELDRCDEALNLLGEAATGTSAANAEAERASLVNRCIQMLEQHLVALKRTANDLYRQGNDQEAITGYTSAIRLLRSLESVGSMETSVANALQAAGARSEVRLHVLYANRAACYKRFRDYLSAVEDCEVCTDLEPSYTKGWIRLCDSLLLLGREAQATEAVKKALVHHPQEAALLALQERIGVRTVDKENKTEVENDSPAKQNKAAAVKELGSLMMMMMQGQ